MLRGSLLAPTPENTLVTDLEVVILWQEWRLILKFGQEKHISLKGYPLPPLIKPFNLTRQPALDSFCNHKENLLPAGTFGHVSKMGTRKTATGSSCPGPPVSMAQRSLVVQALHISSLTKPCCNLAGKDDDGPTFHRGSNWVRHL